MANTQGDDGNNKEESVVVNIPNRLVVGLFALAIGSSGAVNWVSDQFDSPSDYRPDPFTGSDGKKLEKEIKDWVKLYMQERCDNIGDRCDGLDRRLDRVENFMFNNHK